MCVSVPLTSFFNDVKICVASYFMYGVVSHEGKCCTKFLNQYSFICSKFYKLYTYSINIYEFSLLHIFALVLQPWMSAYIRKTDGVYISVPQKRLKHGPQNITLHWINGIIRNNKCIFTKLNAVFILKTAAWTKKYYNG
jgi:hypothetical protein